MAGKTLSFFLKLNDKEFQSGLKKATKSMGAFSKSMQRTGKSLTTSLTLPIAALGAVSVKAFDTQAKAIAQVEAGLKSTGKAAGFTSQQLQTMAADLQSKTLFGDEVILKDATAQLLTFTNISGEQFARTQTAALNLATRLDGDLKSASIQLGKALNDPIANLSALSRSGIQFSNDQKEVIKSLTESGKLAEAQTIILDELEKQYGGAAEAAANAGLGPFQQLKNSLGDVSEEVGKLILQNIEPLKESIEGLIKRLQNLTPEQIQTALKIAAIAAAIGPLFMILGKLTTAFQLLGRALMFLAANPMVAFAVAIGTLVGLLGFAILDMEGFIKTSLKLGKIGRLTAKAIIMFADATGLMSKPEALAAIHTIDGMSKEQDNLAKSTEDSTQAIEDQQKKLEGLIQTMGKDLEFPEFPTIPTPSNNQNPSNNQTQPTMLPEVTIEGGAGNTFNPIPAGPLSSSGGQTSPALQFAASGFDSEWFANIEKALVSFTTLEQRVNETAMTFERAFHSMAVSSQASFAEVGKAAANAARQVIKAAIGKAVASFIADSFAKAGIFGAALAAGAGSIVGSLFNKMIPPFADGGMVSGATLAMVGEGAGTSAINPEVIAPLDKLQGMIGNAGGQVEVVGKISGADILLASDRAQGNRKRTRGY